jgi:hypothetical protein
MKIVDLEFATKKEALNYFKVILNSYSIGDELSEKDKLDILKLLSIHHSYDENRIAQITNVRIAKIPKYNSRAFEVVLKDDTTKVFSYTRLFAAHRSDYTKFSIACRQAVQDDLRQVKLSYFQKNSQKGFVKCQETNELLKWESLHVDHRQPNTFSVIVDRFIELNNIDIENVNYIYILDGQNELGDEDLKQKFREYHKEKANLRIVNKKLNLGRSYQARVRVQKKDLKIE